LGVPDELAKGPRTADELAISLHCNADALHRALRMGAVRSLVRLDPQGRFHATRLTKALTSDDPYSSDQWCSFMASKAHQNAWGDLAETLRTGESAFRRQNGMSFFEWFDEHPAEGRAFAGGLSGPDPLRGVDDRLVVSLPAQLVVVEGVQERSAAHARFSPIDLQMLLVTDGGRERSISEIQGLMTEAGLRPTSVDRTPADLALLEAVKG
jgi:hypothetical protein